MIINFRAIYEYFFKSFNISRDSDVLIDIQKDGVKYVMIIKRSWIYGLLRSWMLLLIVVFILPINCYLLYKNFGETTSTYVLIILLLINLLYWLYSVIIYLFKFRRIRGERSIIVEINDSREQLVEGDKVFTTFFNQTIFNYFLLIGITIVIVIDFIISKNFLNIGLYGVLNIMLLLTQLILALKLKEKFIDLQMDFCVIIPGKIMIFDQKGVFLNTQTMESDKIKTITSKIPHFLGSVFNYGDITILAEGDDSSGSSVGFLNLYYVPHPYETVEEINKLLAGDIKTIDKNINFYLNKILYELNIKNSKKSSLDNVEKIREYLIENDEKIKNDFNSGDEEVKKDIEEIYKIYMK
ncbi:hypothetical protein KAZ01_01235 [Candidatus Gracilibacteria bacterium]|nr:hypothetical protein [Candidatus Gracilibacteria bacterium]